MSNETPQQIWESLSPRARDALLYRGDAKNDYKDSNMELSDAGLWASGTGCMEPTSLGFTVAEYGRQRLTPEYVWATLSPGRQGIARELAHAALEGANQNHGMINVNNAAVAVAYKLWFLLWEGKRTS